MALIRQFTRDLADDIPWGKPAEGPTFNQDYPTEFRESSIPNSGNGWWAKVDIPKNTRLRRLVVDEGSLVRCESLEELETSGLCVEKSVNYGVGHFKDTSTIYFLNPGTACNHADPSREESIIYKHDEEDVFELWTIKDVKAGEEMFISYSKNFAKCQWFDDFHLAAGRTPLSYLGDFVDNMSLKTDPPPEGTVEMKVTLQRSTGFYVGAALSFLKGVDAKPAVEATAGNEAKEAMEAKPAVNALRISGAGEACMVAVAAAAAVQTDGVGEILRVQTNYPRVNGDPCPQVLIDLLKK